MNLTRAEDFKFNRHDGTVIIAPPIERGQMRKILALDRESADTYADIAARRGLQIEIFLQSARWVQADLSTLAGDLPSLLERLTADEEIDIIHAFVAQHHGFNPQNAVEIQQALREITSNSQNSDAPEQVVAKHDEMTTELAVIMNRPQNEIETIPYRDSLDFVSKHAERKSDELKFNAAIHGKELKS